MFDLAEVIHRLLPVKLGAIAAVFLGLFLAVFAMARDGQGVAFRYWVRYVTYLERQLQRQFIWSDGNRIALLQLGGLCAVAVAAMLLDLPYWYVFMFLVAIGPAIVIERNRKKRVAKIETQLDGFILALANALKATPSLGDAFLSVRGLVLVPLREEVELAVKEMRVGSTLDQALLLMASRIGSRQVDSALSALLIGRQVGGNLPKILDTTSATLREMSRLEAMVRAKTAEGKAQLTLLSVFPLVLIFAFSAVKADYFAPLTSSLVGFLITGVAGGCWVASLVLARKIVSVDV